MRELKCKVWYKDLNEFSHVFRFGERVFKDFQDEFVEFTGFKDSSGVEIYEGDIVQTTDDKFKTLVEWIEKDGGWSLWFLLTYCNKMNVKLKIIGNKRQHPELVPTKRGV